MNYLGITSSLQALREKLRCKEIRVAGANRFRNPDDDLPQDFEQRRLEYYEALRLPASADDFVRQLRDEMRSALTILDKGMRHNASVTISSVGNGRITVSPLEAQPEPLNIAALKTEIGSTWSMTSLLAMLKETDLRLGFRKSCVAGVRVKPLSDRFFDRDSCCVCTGSVRTPGSSQ